MSLFLKSSLPFPVLPSYHLSFNMEKLILPLALDAGLHWMSIRISDKHLWDKHYLYGSLSHPVDICQTASYFSFEFLLKTHLLFLWHSSKLLVWCYHWPSLWPILFHCAPLSFCIHLFSPPACLNYKLFETGTIFLFVFCSVFLKGLTTVGS